MSRPGGAAGSPPESCSRRAGLVQFLLVSHSFTGLFFARPDDAPPIQLPGCCGVCCVCLCCGKGRALTVRHRLLVFCTTLVANFFITLETTLGLRSGWWAVAVTVLVIAPLTCWLKNSLPFVSERINSWQPESWKPLAPRVEEVAVVAWLVASIVHAAMKKDHSAIEDVVKNFLISLAIANAIEIATLLFLYCPCRTCCPCCMPEEYEKPWVPYGGSRESQVLVPMEDNPGQESDTRYPSSV